MYKIASPELPTEDVELACYHFVRGETTPLALEMTEEKIVFRVSELSEEEKTQFASRKFIGLIGVRGDDMLAHSKGFPDGRIKATLNEEEYGVSLIKNSFVNDGRYYVAGLAVI